MEWKVSKEVIEIKPHLNSDNLELTKVGPNQLVVQKGLYKSGDVIIFFPEKSQMPESMWPEYPYLQAGRVRTVNLRGEVSQGVTLALDKVQEVFGDVVFTDVSDAEVGADIAPMLGITKWEPPIPAELAGEVEQLDSMFRRNLHKHDVNQFGAYSDQFNPEERVIATEKLHGTQGNWLFLFYRDEAQNMVLTQVAVGSKGLLGKDLVLKDSPNNVYWRAMYNNNLKDIAFGIANSLVNPEEYTVIHMVGEVVPVQSGYSYGLDSQKPEARLFKISVDGVQITHDQVPQAAKDIWVPVLYDGLFSGMDQYKICKGKETVSGKAMHIREGIVISPYVARRAEDNQVLTVKVLNPDYSKKSSGDEFN